MEYVITFTWDDEAGVWIATSNDIPGLVLESGSYDLFVFRNLHKHLQTLSATGFRLFKGTLQLFSIIYPKMLNVHASPFRSFYP